MKKNCTIQFAANLEKNIHGYTYTKTNMQSTVNIWVSRLKLNTMHIAYSGDEKLAAFSSKFIQVLTMFHLHSRQSLALDVKTFVGWITAHTVNKYSFRGSIH